MIPRGPNELDALWFTQALGRIPEFAGTKIAYLAVEKPGGVDGYFGQAVRVRLGYEEGSRSGPETLIAKFAATDHSVRKSAVSAGHYEREISFYREIAPTTPLRTARCYHADRDQSSGDFILLLEDLAPMTPGDDVIGLSARQAAAACREIAKLHAVWWKERDQLNRLPWMRVTGPAYFDAYPQRWASFATRMEDRLPDRLRTVGSRLSRNPHTLRAHLDRAPITFVHGDYRPDNLFWGGTADDPSSVAVVDWQLPSIGPGVVDVGRLLGWGAAVEKGGVDHLALVRVYHDALVGSGVQGYGLEECFRDYGAAVLRAIIQLVNAATIFPALATGADARSIAIVPLWINRMNAALNAVDVDEFLG
jgi:aminoglycoside phosphotransferase (APT) family kinase protein